MVSGRKRVGVAEVLGCRSVRLDRVALLGCPFSRVCERFWLDLMCGTCGGHATDAHGWSSEHCAMNAIHSLCIWQLFFPGPRYLQHVVQLTRCQFVCACVRLCAF